MSTLDPRIQKVKQVIAEKLSVDEVKLVPEASFIEDLGSDSLLNVEIVMALEDEFQIEIPDAEAHKIHTVQDAVNYVTEKVGA